MAGSSVVGALRVVLGADTAALDKGLKDSQSGLAAFGATVATGMAAAAAAVAAAGAAIGVALGKTINDMDTLSKTSQKLGVPVEQLSALAYAADLSDVSFEALSKSVGKLSKNMVEAAAKPTSEAANAFRSLGVSVVDSNGKLKSSDDVLGAIAESFSGLKDGAGKTAVSMAIFGKAGADLIPLLNGGKDSLKEMNEEAKQFGAIVSTKTAKEAEAFNDNLTRLGYAVKGVVVQVASQLLPVLVDISNNMVDSAKNSGLMADTVSVLSTAMKGLVTSGVIVSATLQVAADTLSVIWGGLARLIKGDVTGALDNAKLKVGDISTVATQTMGTLEGLWGSAKTGASQAAVATDGAAKAQKDYNYAALSSKTAIDQFIASQNKSIAGQQAEIQTTGMAAGAKEHMKVVLQGLEVATANNIPITESLRGTLEILGMTAGNTALQLEGMHLKFANQDPLIAYQTQMANTELAMRMVGATAEEIASAQERVAERFGMSWSAVGTNIAGVGGSLSQLSGTFAKENKAMGVASKAFGIGQAIINTQIAVTKALASLPPPASYAAVAAAIAQGAASVATISAQGFKNGLSMTVPGGVGGGDTRMFQAMVEPGEQIDITPNRGGQQDARRGGTSSAPTVIHLTVGGAAGEFVRGLINDINAATADGYRLNMA